MDQNVPFAAVFPAQKPFSVSAKTDTHSVGLSVLLLLIKIM